MKTQWVKCKRYQAREWNLPKYPLRPNWIQTKEKLTQDLELEINKQIKEKPNPPLPPHLPDKNQERQLFIDEAIG